jgi:hypothetical protein
MTSRSEFLKRISVAADHYTREILAAVETTGQVSELDLALSILDASDDQGWDRLTWTADSDEYSASYGYDDEGNEFDPIPPPSAVEFARYLLRHYSIVRKPT